jgi:hypothetical protein
MKFLVHYIVRSPIKDLNFDLVWDGPVSARDLGDLRDVCTSDAIKKGARPTVQEIILAGIFPIPDGEPIQRGGS